MVAAARKPSHRALVALCGFIGCRVGEALSVRPSDIDLGSMVLKVDGKGDKIRFVPISTEAWGYMADAVTAAFLNGDERIINVQERVARQNITTLAKRAGLSRHVSSHDLRSTFSTAVYDKTGDIRLVQELLGHSSVETTQIYIGVKHQKMRDAVEL
jgi:site-specific recombinase XerD